MSQARADSYPLSHVPAALGIVVYQGWQGRELECPVCGRPAQEFAHLEDGRVFAKHSTEVFFRVCQVQ
jgi:hypothetical protein